MRDDRDFSWMGPPAPAPVAPVEHVLWTVTKGVGRAEMRVRGIPSATSSAPWSTVGTAWRCSGAKSTSQVTASTLGAVADDNKADWLARGWVVAS